MKLNLKGTLGFICLTGWHFKRLAMSDDHFKARPWVAKEKSNHNKADLLASAESVRAEYSARDAEAETFRGKSRAALAAEAETFRDMARAKAGVIAEAWAARDKTNPAAWAIYEKAVVEAWAVYGKAVGSARAVYEKAIAEA